ncbi:MAG TPA: class I SAM-dependent methyltransferase [Xanthomonadaceae bacterium]|jgi:SAM-dependent methyltransferase|nr:class I SAM-dependent methyltransferase [Xanthomonadaceae bacterium]
MKRVLNVGGNDRRIPIPDIYRGWEHLMLDIDPASGADVIADARELATLGESVFDSVYCSHNLEHYYAHEVPRVLRGIRHVMKPDGFFYVLVPDITAVARAIASGLDIEDVLYHSPAGPITPKDVLYGWGKEIERSGQSWFAHKTGFTARSLMSALHAAGFGAVYPGHGPYELAALAFVSPPSVERQRDAGLLPA